MHSREMNQIIMFPEAKTYYEPMGEDTKEKITEYATAMVNKGTYDFGGQRSHYDRLYRGKYGEWAFSRIVNNRPDLIDTPCTEPDFSIFPEKHDKCDVYVRWTPVEIKTSSWYGRPSVKGNSILKQAGQGVWLVFMDVEPDEGKAIIKGAISVDDFLLKCVYDGGYNIDPVHLVDWRVLLAGPVQYTHPSNPCIPVKWSGERTP